MLRTYFVFKDKTAAWIRVSMLFQFAGLTKRKKREKSPLSAAFYDQARPRSVTTRSLSKLKQNKMLSWNLKEKRQNIFNL